MSFRLSRAATSLVALSFAVAAYGCAAPPAEPFEQGEDAIVDVQHTDVERQSIGNCWLYAHVTWIESMHLAATAEKFDVSQSYWTYWHWFDQIAGSSWTTSISTGGNWDTANNIVKRYGLMPEADFVFADTTNEMSSRQKTALDAMNESLKSGALSTAEARRDRKIVRAELDRAWGLTDATKTMLDGVFGEDVSKTFASRSGAADASGTPILRAADFKVAYPSSPGAQASEHTLTDAMREWRQTYYSTRSGRATIQRVQRALHDAQPVIITWFVDFNALENRAGDLRGSFNKSTLDELGPGRQGGHMTVLEDYEATLESGELLKAGVTLDKSDPEQGAKLEQALAAGTSIKFLRVKNSWGAARPDRAFSPGMPGYHDLYMDYLNGPVKRCAQRDGETDTSNCTSETTPLQNFVLPPGY